jgi:DNA repair protein RadC
LGVVCTPIWEYSTPFYYLESVMFKVNECQGVYTVSGEGDFCDLIDSLGVEAKKLLSLKEKNNIVSQHHAVEYLKPIMQNLEHEEFWMLLLDNKNNLIKSESVFRGTIDAASIYPREIIKLVLKYNAAAVILAHNHPSGNSSPSRSDHQMTSKIKMALATIDVGVLDHIIYGMGETYSFASEGVL